MNAPTYVYVVVQGCDSNQDVIGVYSSPERAMEAHPVRKPRHPEERDGGWQPDVYAERQSWYNGLDWEAAETIERFELDR